MTPANKMRRPHSERFCDVALIVKFYCDCDVAKSLRMGPNPRSRERSLDEIDDMENLNFLMVDLRYNFVSCHLMPSMRT